MLISRSTQVRNVLVRPLQRPTHLHAKYIIRLSLSLVVSGCLVGSVIFIAPPLVDPIMEMVDSAIAREDRPRMDDNLLRPAPHPEPRQDEKANEDAVLRGLFPPLSYLSVVSYH